MRVFVSEFVYSGAWPEPVLPASLAREGRAMLLTLLQDVAALPGVTVCTTWDSRLGPFSPREGIADGSPLSVECEVVHSPDEERAAFQRLAAECDATYVIAPELDDLLTLRVCTVLDCGGRSLNASPEAIRASSDKWETFQRLSRSGIATVPTARFDPGSPLPFGFPLVVKPRFGAGSQDTFHVRDRNDLHTAAARFSAERATTEAIVQPYVARRSLSVAVVFHTDGRLRELWPITEQRLSDDGRFSYLGGRVGNISDFGFRISDLMGRIQKTIPGLRGYVGFDLIVPDEPGTTPLVVDINPRLTTSYLGYRELSQINLAGRILWPDDLWPPLGWIDGIVEFDAAGRASLRGAAKRAPES